MTSTEQENFHQRTLSGSATRAEARVVRPNSVNQVALDVSTGIPLMLEASAEGSPAQSLTSLKPALASI